MIPDITHYALLHVRPDGCELVPQTVTGDDFDAFLHCLGMWQWQQAQPDEWRDRKAA